jgi:8-oxo-dGTP diphosphatase
MTQLQPKTHQEQNIKVAVDNCIFTIKDGNLRVLLIQMKEKFPNAWALPGGLIDNNETTDHAARRILKDQTSVDSSYLEQLYTFTEIERDPLARVISVSYIALIPSEEVKLKTTKKYLDVRWFSYKDLPKLAYDHKHIITYARERLKNKIAYTPIAHALLPKEFTLTELQKTYELILEETLDKRNFRKKMLENKVVTETGKISKGQAHRPALLFKFVSEKM